MTTVGRRGLTVFVTGATSGIGRLVATALAGEGASTLVHGRDRARVDALVAELAGVGGQAEGFVADLASLADVADIGRALTARGGIEVLINNAGIGFGSDRTKRETSVDGFELRLAVNYLAPFVLSEILLRSGQPSRAIVNVASAGQLALDLDDLQAERSYDGVAAYRNSKLAMIMNGLDLAAAHPDVAVNSLHPGTFLDTGMVREAGITPLGAASDGSDAILALVRDSLAGKTGAYLDVRRETRADAQAYDAPFRAALRAKTLDLVAPFLAT